MICMASYQQHRRLFWLCLGLLTCFGALAARLVQLQVVQHEEMLGLAMDNTQRTFVREPRRGDIRDIRGNLLATSKEVKTVCADPSLIGPHADLVARTIAPLIRMPLPELAQKLTPRTWVDAQGKTNVDKYVVLERKVDEERWRDLQKAMAELPHPESRPLTKREKVEWARLRTKALFTEPDQLRVYPNQSLAAHVIGFVGVNEVITNGSRAIVTKGVDGVEFTMNTALTGVQGFRQTLTDAKRREMVAFREQDVAAKAGLNVVLTLDAGIQHIIETEMAEALQKHTPEGAMVVALRPSTGEILGLASYPNFDLNDPGKATLSARRNRIISDVAEPGSTFKIVVVSAGLNEGLIKLTDQFDCENGLWQWGGRSLKDDHHYGLLSVRDVIGKSSNIGSAKIALLLREQKVLDYIKAFGFGQRSGISLPGEVRGIVHELPKWSKISITRLPMGHEIAVTPIQMAMAMAAMANGGLLMQPMIIDRLEDDSGKVVVKHQPRVVRRVIQEAAARQTVEALKSVVTTNGTGPKAALKHHTVAGKTGTAQKAGAGGYISGAYYSSFIGFFPADNPQLLIAVSFDHPRNGYYGSTVAAPVFHRIAERAANYLAIPADIAPEPPKVAAHLPHKKSREPNP
ncbi:MAG TPA: penicillin-binding protein 2 [Methylomirabilota bacterium]|nr:penicillin-binding protein 2 [Methylomirabilota bacterium]